MPKVLAIDYGKKRTGFALSDEQKIFAFGLCTQETGNNLKFISTLCLKENLDTILIGLPKTLQNEDAEIVPLIRKFIGELKSSYPLLQIIEADERFSSKMAVQSMVNSGMKKKDRQNKSLVDEISATILLQHYLETI